MTELLTAAQMRAIEQAAIESGEVTGLELMERAGQGVVDAIFEEWPDLVKTDHRAVVLCGPGNNGGDGFVVARLLKEWGWEVEVFLYGDAGKLPADARVNYERWGEMGDTITVGFPQITAEALEQLWPSILGHDFGEEKPVPEIVVDALFGTGLSWAVSGLYPLFDIRSQSWPLEWGGGSRWVAVDVPTGMCADSGRYFSGQDANTRHEAILSADLTVTFHAEKQGHHLSEGPADCGHVILKSIGLPEIDEDDLEELFEDNDAGDWTYKTKKMHGLLKESGHKYSHGHALILSGGVGKGGAARLAARGALRIGAGVVTVGCPPAALQENAAALDAIMVRSLKGGEGLAEALQEKRINGLCIGPGLGVGRAAEMLGVALGDGGVEPRATVIDADGLTALARDAALFQRLHANCVLTPHAGEFARLFPDIAGKLNAPAIKSPAYSKVDATRDAAARAGCVVLFKGPDTVIAAPDGCCAINSAHYERSAPWLATAGSGDVLAGFITGLLARGFTPLQAAETGAWLHVECAMKFGPGLIAEDLPETLPKVFQDLGV